eukprot:jgi/Hompol1/2146/HPOL_005874-RA
MDKSSGAPPTLRSKCAAILSYLGRYQNQIDLNHAIGNAFLAHLAIGDSPELSCEILNGLFDLYADSAFDYDEPVFVQGGMLKRLETLENAVKRELKAVDRRKTRALRERADEMLLNLGAFIRYKKTERK